MEQLIIRKGKLDDIEAVLDLIMELAIYEKAPEQVKVSKETLIRDGFGVTKPLFELNVAELNQEIVGATIYYYGYSTWKGKLLYLDDIVVSESHRNQGIGKQLINELILEAKQNNVQQMRWHVLDWNTPAIEFYKKYEASFEDDWITCKLTHDQINRFNAQ